MASPFKIFRKHQKVMLAVLGVLVMLGFVVFPVVLEGMRQRSVADRRVATTKPYGRLHESELRSLRWRRQVTVRFLETVARAVRDAVLQTGGSADQVQMALQPVELAFQELSPVAGLSPLSDEGLAETWLLARRAEELGIVVDDETIRGFIAQLTQGLVSSQDMSSLLKQINLGPEEMLRVLREELAAMRLRSMFRRSLAGVTPAERWDYFQRLQRKAAVQSAPVEVSKFLDDVPDPDEATLTAFFDQHKYDPYDPMSPEPGFQEPKKVAIEYLKAGYESFFEKQREAIPQEEVRQFYEEHKERRYRREDLPALEPKEPAAEMDQPAEKGDTAGEEGAADEPSPEPAEPPAESPAEEPEQSPAEPPAVPAEQPPAGPPEESPVEEPAETARAEQPEKSPPEEPAGPSTEPPGEQSPQEAEPGAGEAPAADSTAPPTEPSTSDDAPAGESSAAGVASPFRLASLVQQEEETPAMEPPALPGPATQPPAPELPAREPSGDVPDEPAGEAGEPAPEPAAGEASSAEPPQFVPLEKVEDEIRNELARTRTDDAIDSLLNDLRSKLSRYRDQLVRYEVDLATQGGDPTLKAPEAPDFAKLAKEHGLEAAKTGLISAFDLRKLDIGNSTVEGRTGLVQAAMEMPLQRPEISRDSEGNAFLFWKTEQVEPRIPELDEPDVRKRVVRQWKMIRAREAAVREAERLAAEARKAGKPLAEAFAGDSALRVTDSEPFTWLTYGSIPAWMAAAYGPPRISEVQGVDAPGHEFMRAVFALGKGEIGTAMNQPRTVAYVVQVTDSNPLPETLWSMFKSESYGSYYRAGDHDRYLAEKAWLEAIKSQVRFQWDPQWKLESARREVPG